MTPEPWQLSALKFNSIAPITGHRRHRHAERRGRNDQLSGGPNDDTFVFNVGSGNDTIIDFNRGNEVLGEHDIIDVRAYGFSDWNALQAVITDNGQFGYALIQLSATDSIDLYGVVTADLHQTDFII